MYLKPIARRYTQLDGIRGFAAIMILSLHFSHIDTLFTNNFFVKQSWLFVDFFFCLSGFVIAKKYLNSIKDYKSFRDFMIKRIIKLYPLLFVTSMLYLLYEIIGTFLNKNLMNIPIFIIQTFDSLLFLNSTPLMGTTQGINPPSWAISAEVISYLVFGIVIIFFNKRKVFISLLIVLLSIIFMLYKKDFAFNNGDYGFIRGLLGFNLGIITSKMSRNISNHFGTFIELIFLSIIIILFYTTFKLRASDFVNYIYLIIPFIFALSIYIFHQSNGIVSTFLNCTTLQRLGNLSLSIYLIHYLIITVVYHIFYTILKFQPQIILNTLMFFLVIFVTLLLSNLSFIWIETKISENLRITHFGN